MFYERIDSGKAAQDQMRRAEKKLQEMQEPIIPASSPLALMAKDHKGKKTSLLLYKSYFGVFALDLRDGKLAWISSSPWSLQHLLDPKSGSKKQIVDHWLSQYQTHYPQVLFENSTVGTLSTDGEFVYVIEDLAVPPMPQPKFNGIDFFGRINNQRTLDKDLEEAVAHNRLYAFSLATNGKLYWELPADENGPLADCYFLGPPLPLDGLLYLLIRKNKQLSLLCLDPKHRDKKTQYPRPKIVFVKPLVEIATSVLEDPLRRTWAAHLAYADGILVCPTNASVVVGVDVLANRLVWVYPYRDKSDVPEQPAPINDRFRRQRLPLYQIGPDGQLQPLPDHEQHPWKVTAPVISDGKVVFTTPDARSLHCVNLRDGSRLWHKQKQDEDLYLGNVYNGKVLIVGKKTVRALSLATGDPLWTLETGMPSGQGVAAGVRYYLPLQRGVQSKQPEILVLDIIKGQVIAHTKTRSSRPGGTDVEVPGNLVFAEGKLISQSPWEIVAYPLLQEQIDKEKSADQSHP